MTRNLKDFEKTRVPVFNPWDATKEGEANVMSDEDQIKWVQLKLDFSPEQEAFLQERAQVSGLSLKCYCVHLIHENLLKDASPAQKEQWQRNFPATLRRNGCQEDLYV